MYLRIIPLPMIYYLFIHLYIALSIDLLVIFILIYLFTASFCTFNTFNIAMFITNPAFCYPSLMLWPC